MKCDLYPTYSNKYNKKKGECAQCLEEATLAFQYFQTAIAYCPSHVLGLIGLAKIERELGHIRDAKAYLDSVLRIDASNYKAWAELGKVQEMLGEFDSASNSFLTALELEREEPIESFQKIPRWL